MLFVICIILPPHQTKTDFLEDTIDPSKAVLKISKSPFNTFNPLKYFASLCKPTIKRKNDTKRIFQFCGGTFLKAHKVLTAAHCVYDKNDNKLKLYDLVVVHGSLDVFGTNGTIYNIKEIIVHSKFNPNGVLLQYDMAILILDRNVTGMSESDFVRVAGSTPHDGTVGMFSGFGRLYNVNIMYLKIVLTQIYFQNGPRPIVLITSLYKVIDREDKICFNYQPLHHHYCAGEMEESSKSLCGGDSGGGLINSNYEIIGVVSKGIKCSAEGNPAVFTDVYSLSDFIGSRGCVRSMTTFVFQCLILLIQMWNCGSH